MRITIGGHDGTAAPATPAAGIRQAWMPREQGTPPDVGTTDVTSVPEFGGGERLATLPAAALPETIFTMPSVQVSPAVALMGPGPAMAAADATLTPPSAEAAPDP